MNNLIASDPWADLTPPYRTIVADPPWQYRTTAMTTRVSHNTSAAEDHYSTMTNQQVMDLPVAKLVADNAHLYLWTTNPKMFGDRNRTQPGPVEIMEAWGFRYITTLTWVKTGALGMGFYFRGETEHVLFGVRGKCPIPTDRRVKNVFTAPKRGHSRKPPLFFEIVDRVSPEPRVELFSREPQLGWDSWGHGFESTAMRSIGASTD